MIRDTCALLATYSALPRSGANGSAEERCYRTCAERRTPQNGFPCRW